MHCPSCCHRWVKTITKVVFVLVIHLLPELGEGIVGSKHGHVHGVAQICCLVQLQPLVQITQLFHVQQLWSKQKQWLKLLSGKSSAVQKKYLLNVDRHGELIVCQMRLSLHLRGTRCAPPCLSPSSSPSPLWLRPSSLSRNEKGWCHKIKIFRIFQKPIHPFF